MSTTVGPIERDWSVWLVDRGGSEQGPRLEHFFASFLLFRTDDDGVCPVEFAMVSKGRSRSDDNIMTL